MQLLRRLLERALVDGTLIVIDPAGRRHAFGSGDGPALAVRLGSRRLAHELALDPLNAAARAYVEGTLTIEDGDIGSALELLGRNLAGFDDRRLPAWPARRRAPHLELDGALFSALLGPLHWYHAGRFDDPALAPDAAAIARLTARAGLAPGQRVLVSAPDSGALALAVLAAAPVEVVAMAGPRAASALQSEAAARGFGDRLRVEGGPIPDSPLSFDRVILAGRLEEPGPIGIPGLSRLIARILKPRGLAVLQGVMRQGDPRPAPPWAVRFRPGWRPPSLSGTIACLNRAGLWLQSVDTLGRDGPLTVGGWITALEREGPAIARLYNQDFVREWQVALGGLFLALTAGRLTAVEMTVSQRREGGG